MRFFLYEGGGDFGDECARYCREFGFTRVDSPGKATFALAPLLRRKLTEAEWDAPLLGTLIFHPSILPYHRGPDAIRWAAQLGERVSGITWFWCDGGLDTGPICEQAPVVLKIGESPGRAYHTRYVPAGLVALRRAPAGIAVGDVSRVEQDHSLASYESFYPPRRE